MLLKHNEFIREAYGDDRKTGVKGVGIGKLSPPADKDWTETWRKRMKMANVSLSLVAMLLCSLYKIAVAHNAFVLLFSFSPLQRQFERLMEMLILRRLDPTDPALLKAYRLQVKERLYRFNFVSSFLHVGVGGISLIGPDQSNAEPQEILVTLEKDERLEKLEETFQSVIEGYQGILGLLEG